jgi:hypothetical protein
MNAKRKIPEELSTCFEAIPFSGARLKNADSKGVGSLCAEIMKNALGERKGFSDLDNKALLKQIITEKEVNK